MVATEGKAINFNVKKSAYCFYYELDADGVLHLYKKNAFWIEAPTEEEVSTLIQVNKQNFLDNEFFHFRNLKNRWRDGFILKYSLSDKSELIKSFELKEYKNGQNIEVKDISEMFNEKLDLNCFTDCCEIICNQSLLEQRFSLVIKGETESEIEFALKNKYEELFQAGFGSFNLAFDEASSIDKIGNTWFSNHVKRTLTF